MSVLTKAAPWRLLFLMLSWIFTIPLAQAQRADFNFINFSSKDGQALAEI